MSLPPVLQDRLRLPVVASPMFILSNPDLVIAQCTSGVVGSFPSLNARPQPMLREWLLRITEALAKHDANHPESPAAPYAVNLIVHRSNDRLEEDLATVVEFEVPIVITSLGARTDVNDAVHSYGGVVLHDVTDNRYARKAVEKGADGLIAVAAGAGGHAGTQSPFALVQEIREWFDGPLLLSGSIAHGRSVLAAQAAGADLAYVGSAFIATEEAGAADAYKQMVVDSAASDIVYSNLFTGVHGNYLRGSIEAAGLDPADLAESDPSAMDFGTGEKANTQDGRPEAKAWRDIWGAGHGVGAVKAVLPASALVDRLAAEYAAARTALLG
ncbi:NAD(P)H-dependent flavin oxidoreductase [Rhodococcus tukisamuensis]|uniref:Nitronate monooxygenase n=1 Tax=Rhodococcus tukisamuensis TaxID=168276 RepID=A0A1G6SGM3_9NOCA|nr:nitronate monooxygenase family protein [Rhodococcus tukisamuensis]SDD15794.1 nitronate monooxygenase [Rhodococcus tukisamuensis]